MILDEMYLEPFLEFFQEGGLAFMLVFALVYFLLQKIQLFKDGNKSNKKINVIIALTLAVAAIAPHFTSSYYGYGEQVDVVEILNSALPSVSLLVVIIVLFLVVVSVFGVNINVAGGSVLSGLVVLFSLLAIIYIFLTSAGIIVTDWDFLYWLDPELKNILLTLLVMGVLIAFLTHEKDASKTWFDGVKDFFQSLTNPPNNQGGG